MKLARLPLCAAALLLPLSARANDDAGSAGASTAAPTSTTTRNLGGEHSTDGEEWLGMPFTVALPVLLGLMILFGGLFYFWRHISDAFLTTARNEEAKACIQAGHKTMTMTAIEMYKRGNQGYERVWLCDMCGRKSADIGAEFERCDACRVNFCTMCMREREGKGGANSRFPLQRQGSMGELAFGPGGAVEPDPEGGRRVKASPGDELSTGSSETPRRALELDAHIAYKPHGQNWKPDSGIVCNERKLPSSAYGSPGGRPRPPAQAAWLSRLVGSCAGSCCGDDGAAGQPTPVGRPLKAANV